MLANEGLIYTSDNCIGCNKCIKGCPVIGSNIALSKEEGSRIVVDGTKCIHCGKCLKNCEHGARHFRDDCDELIKALRSGEDIDLLIAPSFFLTHKEKINAYLGFFKSLNFENIYDVTSGATVTTWAYISYIKMTGKKGLISSACPVIVDYIEKYKPELFDSLMPIMSPVACLKKYLQKKGDSPKKKYAFLCPCIGKHDEYSSFTDGHVADYTITFSSLENYIKNNLINLDNFYLDESKIQNTCLSAFYPIPGGLRNNINFFLNADVFIKQVEGPDEVYPYLDFYAKNINSGTELPYIIDALNCKGGCAEGSASDVNIKYTDDLNIQLVSEKDSLSKKNQGTAFDATLEPNERFSILDSQMTEEGFSYEDFMRTFNSSARKYEEDITPAIIESVFKRLHKDTYEERNINCTSCGYKNCREMAIAIAHGYNRPENCVHYMRDTLEKEQSDLKSLLEQLYSEGSTMSPEKYDSEYIVQAISHAISEIEKAQEYSLNESRSKAQFLASMTHELRTPLNAILNMTDALKEELPKGFNTDNIESIKSAGENLLETVNELLDMSKLNSGKFSIVEAPYKLYPFINDITNLIRFRAMEKKLSFTQLTDPSLPSELIGDSKRIRQILINLLGNAVKYTKTGGVTLTTSWNKSKENPVITFCVEDTGIGIKEEDIPFLFKAYTQVDEAKNHNIEGTGLGLSIADSLSKEMNASIDVKSKYGQGTAFTLTIPQKIEKYIPLSDNELANVKKSFKEDVSSVVFPYAKVLIVDDMTVNQKVTGTFLSKFQCRYDLASSGKEALDMVVNTKYDLIILDYQMPEMNGLDVLQTLRLSSSPSANSPVIIMSAEDGETFANEHPHALFQGYLDKPVEKKHFESEVAKIISSDLIITTDNDKLPKKGIFSKTAGKNDFNSYLDAVCALERIAKSAAETQICHSARLHREAIQHENFDFITENAHFMDSQLELLRSLI